MLLAKIFAISVGVSCVFMGKAVMAPSASASLQPMLLQQHGAAGSVDPLAIMRAASRDMPAESWSGH